jgi:hypothetical protein
MHTTESHRVWKDCQRSIQGCCCCGALTCGSIGLLLARYCTHGQAAVGFFACVPHGTKTTDAFDPVCCLDSSGTAEVGVVHV